MAANFGSEHTNVFVNLQILTVIGIHFLQADAAEQVLHEVDIRGKVNDVIQVLLLVLNSSSCSLPCAKWYVQQLGSLLKKEGKKKGKDHTTSLSQGGGDFFYTNFLPNFPPISMYFQKKSTKF